MTSNQNDLNADDHAGQKIRKKEGNPLTEAQVEFARVVASILVEKWAEHLATAKNQGETISIHQPLQGADPE